MKTLLTILAISLMASAAFGQLLITGVCDGPLPGGLPKAIEFYALEDIADLSVYAVESANNGGGIAGPEFTFPADAVAEGEFIYLATEDFEFNNWFGFMPNYVDGVASINGDDAIVLYMGETVIDVFGEPDVDGTGEPWEYLDGWAYRVDETMASDMFMIADWTFSGPNALDGETSNDTAAMPFPAGTYMPEPSVATESQSLSQIKALF